MPIDYIPEILLLGTGSTVLPPPPELRSYISSLGIQLDVMDSVSPTSPALPYTLFFSCSFARLMSLEEDLR